MDKLDVDANSRPVSRLRLNERLRTVLAVEFRNAIFGRLNSPAIDLLWIATEERTGLVDSIPEIVYSDVSRTSMLVEAAAGEEQPGFRVVCSEDQALLDQIPFRCRYHASWVVEIGKGCRAGYWCAIHEATDVPTQGDIERVFEALRRLVRRMVVEGDVEYPPFGTAKPIEACRPRDTASLLHDIMTPVETMSLLLSELDRVAARLARPLVNHMKASLSEIRTLVQAELLSNIQQGESDREFQGPGMHRRTEFRLRSFCEELQKAFAFLAERKGVHLDFRLPMNWNVSVPRHKLWRILSNMLGNAIRHSTGSTIEIVAASCVPLQLSIRNLCDSNRSMEEPTSSTGHWLYGGTGYGLGLGIIQGLSADLGLEFQRRYHPPYLDCSLYFSPNAAEPIGDSYQIEGRVMVVDDNPTAARLRARQLRAHSAHVEWSSDIEDVYAQLSADTNWSVVMDYHLGDVTADDFLARLPQAPRNVVLCTGDSRMHTTSGSSRRLASRWTQEGRYPVIDKCRSAATLCELLSLQERCRKPTIALERASPRTEGKESE